MSYRVWVTRFIVIVLLLEAAVAAVNYWFDPLWCFGFDNAANRITPVIDTRLQKTSRLIRSDKVYDALLIGSSRVEQLRQEDFAPLRVFNYAAPSMYPDEYGAYLDLFVRRSGSKPVTVFLGLDFYGSNQCAFDHARRPEYYLETCSSPLYPLKNLVYGSSLKYSLKMLRGDKEIFSYDRLTLNKMTKVVDRAQSDRLMEKQLEVYRKTNYGDYRYDPDYRRILKRLQESHPQVRFVVFTTPETEQLFRLLIDKGLFAEYQRWLTDIVAVFGGVYNLMLPSPFASERSNFLDAHHLYPDKAAAVVRLITGKPVAGDAAVGYYVTRETVQQHLTVLGQSIEQLRKGPTQ